MKENTNRAIDTFNSLKFNRTSTLGVIATHVFENGWGVSVLKLVGNRWTEGYSHKYEVMLTHDGHLCHADDTPLTCGDSVPMTDSWDVISLLEKVEDLDPKPTTHDAQHAQQ